MTWLLKKSIKIQQELLAKGILVTAPKRGNNIIPEDVTDNSFVLGDRTLTFFHPEDSSQHPPSPNAPENEAVDRISSFLEKILQNNKKIQSFIKIKPHATVTEQDLRKAEKAKRLGQIWGTRVSPYIYSSRNKSHHTEVFFPITYNNPLDDTITMGSYIFPWSSNFTKFKFQHIKKYVMAGCLGGTLTGYDQKEGEHLLIKHDLDFFNDQKIIEVSDSAESPYDKMLFHEFEKMASLIVNLGESRDLFYHMPYYDYALFGIKLYVQGRITNEALDQFFECIFIRKERHIEKIQEVAQKYKLNLTIQSPFEALFQDKANYLEDFIKNIREVFKDFLKEPSPTPDTITEKQLEKELVHFCLKRLLADDNSANKDCQQVWSDFITITKADSIENIEELFKTANAVMIGMASKGEKENQVCSILPLSEKPIQVEYAKYAADCEKAKKNTISAEYGHVVNLTVPDPVVCYCPGNKSKSGLLFYNHKQEDTLTELMDDDTLFSISANVGAFAAKTPPILSILPGTIASPELSPIKKPAPETFSLSPASSSDEKSHHAHAPYPTSEAFIQQLTSQPPANVLRQSPTPFDQRSSLVLTSFA
jgi:hypothetical protein